MVNLEEDHFIQVKTLVATGNAADKEKRGWAGGQTNQREAV